MIEVKINGVVDGSAFVGDTQPGSETTFNNVDLQTPSNTTDFDNYWFDDAGYKGIIRIETKRPSANGDDAAWTGSYTDVDDVTPDDNTTVLKSSTNNQEHAVKFPSHSLSGSAVILAVAHEHRPVKETAGNITLGLKEGGTKTYEGAARNLGIAYTQIMAIWETNPRTSAAFTVGQLNSDSNAVQAYIKAGGM